MLELLNAPANVLDDYETILHFELNQIASNAQKTIDAHIEQFKNAQQYAESLQIELINKEQYAESLQIKISDNELELADKLQKVIDAESRNIVLKTANEALENQLVKLHDVERQLMTIRSYKLFKLLSLSKKVLRKVMGRK